MKQCLFLESGGVYKKLLRINRTKNIITGSFFNSVVRAFPDLKDFHFTYPPRGNYHVTIVSLDGTEYRVYATSATRRSAKDKLSELIDKESPVRGRTDIGFVRASAFRLKHNVVISAT